MKIFQSLKKIIGIVIPMVLSSIFSQGQTTPSYSDFITSCVSNDLTLVGASVINPDPNLCYSCKQDDPITQSLSLAIYNKTGSRRTRVRFWAKLKVMEISQDKDGNVVTKTSTYPIDVCDGPIEPGETKTITTAPQTFKCGSKLILTDIVIAWTDASKGAKNDCDNLTPLTITPKCGTLPEYIVKSGIIVFGKTSNGICDVSSGKPTNASIELKVEGGTSGYSYSWEATNGGEVPAGQASLQNLTGIKKSGTYSVTITDAKNCTAVRAFSVTVNQLPTLLANPIQSNCITGGKPSDGAINLSVSGGTGTSFTYLWSTSGGSIPSGQANSQNLSGIKSSGTYSVTVTDNVGCKESATAMITILQIPSIASSNITPSSCTSDGKPSDGAIDIGITGGVPGYTYSWTSLDGEVPSGQAGNQDLTAIKTSGTYAVAITDAKGCMQTAAYIITILRSPIIEGVNIVNSSCSSGTPTLGAINITVSSGAPVYTYAWTASNGGAIPSGQANNEDLSGISTSGSYKVVVTDNNSCTASSIYSVTVLIPPAIPSYTIIEQPSICGAATGSLRITNSTGDIQYSFNGGGWTSNQTVGGISPGAGSTYTISSKNNYGCISQVIGLCSTPTSESTITQVSNLTTTESNVAQPTVAVAQQSTSTNVSNLGSATLESSLSVKAMPNPFNDQVKFTITSIERGTATLDIYNLYGQKVKTVYNGIVNPGINYFDLRLASAQRTSELIYVFTMGTQKITGKLIQNAQ